MIVLILFTGFLYYSYHLKNRGVKNFWERTVLDVASPAIQTADSLIESVYQTVSTYLYLVEAEKENQTLRKQVAELSGQEAKYQELSLENERLRKLLHFQKEIEDAFVSAQVVGEDASGWFRTVLINKGELDGIKEGMPVVVADGVVGRIIRTGQTVSRIMLLPDPSSSIAVLIQRTRVRSICQGQGDSLSLEFASNDADIEVGDRLISSGMGGLFPKGVTVGRIVSAAKPETGFFQTIEVEPAVDYSRLEEVIVLLRELDE